MLWLLICAGALVGGNRIAPQDSSYMEREDVTVTTKPHIYYCRSPNMEDFTCWWRPLDNASDSHDDVTYVLTYSLNKEPVHECPDYVTGGPHSCHFDKRHTSVWKVYCMTVTAVTPFWNYTSHEHCLDVADIVQMEAPVNLTYNLSDAGGDEVGHNTRLSWAYPVPSALQYDWITLEYELQYRHVAEPDNWKVKQRLRDSHIELLGLPVGDYVVRVRCRSRNSDLWSRWSSTLIMTIPARPPAGKMLVLILMTGFGMVVLLAIGFGIIPQSKRIRAYFLPPIPKPHIIGIDPLLLKMGHIEEINRHFSSFHGYRPPSYAEEVWDRVSAAADDDDDGFPPPALPEEEEDPPPPQSSDHHHHLLQKVTSSSAVAPPPQSPPDATAAALLLLDPFYVQSPSSRCCRPPPAARPPVPDVVQTPSPACPPWPPGIVFLPGGGDYSVMGTPTPPAAAPPPRSPSQPDFYTCVQIMNETGEVLLVPCLNPAAVAGGGGGGGGEEEVVAAPWCPPPPTERGGGGDEEEEEEEGKKKKQLAERQARKTSERKGDVAAPPSLPVGNVG